VKSFEQKLSNPDLQDMMEQAYPLETTKKLMDKNFDPGRFRVYPLLKDVYGGTQSQVEKRLKLVSFGGSRQFNGSNSAAQSLQSAARELALLAKSSRKISAAIYPGSGTYNYRVISGTNLLSPHAFGIAIDLARDKRDYWKWATTEQGQSRLLEYPEEVVQVFQKHGFIWGGKWNHFDILHFEYRPEIILKAKYFGSSDRENKQWYEGAPLYDENVKNCMDKINKVLK
jgi:hypothetical protein